MRSVTARAGVAVRGPQRRPVQLVEQGRHGVGGGQQTVPKLRAEGAGDHRMGPQRVAVQRGQDLYVDASVRVAAHDVMNAETCHGLDGGTGCEPAEQVGGPCEGDRLPRRGVGVDGLQPQAGRLLVEIFHQVGTRQ